MKSPCTSCDCASSPEAEHQRFIGYWAEAVIPSVGASSRVSRSVCLTQPSCDRTVAGGQLRWDISRRRYQGRRNLLRQNHNDRAKYQNIKEPGTREQVSFEFRKFDDAVVLAVSGENILQVLTVQNIVISMPQRFIALLQASRFFVHHVRAVALGVSFLRNVLIGSGAPPQIDFVERNKLWFQNTHGDSLAPTIAANPVETREFCFGWPESDSVVQPTSRFWILAQDCAFSPSPCGGRNNTLIAAPCRQRRR